MEKSNFKSVILPLCICMCFCFVVALFSVIYVNRATNKIVQAQQDIAKAYNPTATTETTPEKELTQGGTVTIKTSDGTSLEFTVPDNHYLITDDYLDLVQYSYGTTDPVTSDNLIITGNTTQSSTTTQSVNCSTFSDIFNLYSQIYGEEFSQNDISAVYSPTYRYMVDGVIPEDAPDNFEVKELDPIDFDGTKYRVFDVTFSSVYEDSDEVYQSQQIAAYSDTQDPVEIIVYDTSNSAEVEYPILKTFITGK